MLFSTFISGLKAKFNNFEHKSTDELEKTLEISKKVSSNCWEVPENELICNQFNHILYIWDVREKDEHTVSHIASAENILPKISSEELIEKLRGISNAHSNKVKIVCYCSIGYRSSIMVNRVNKVSNDLSLDISASNLDGSIFKWANENKALLNDKNDETDLVHPYNWVFGKMLNADKRWKYEDMEQHEEK